MSEQVSILGRWVKTRPCRSCRQQVVWTVTEQGKRMPVDPDPTAAGNLELTWEQDDSAEWFLRSKVLTFRGPPINRWRSHFATCRFASLHRKR